MKNLLNPKLLFVVNTLPAAVLFLLFAGQYSIIKSLLDETSRQLWILFGVSLLVLVILNFIYALWLTLKKREISIVYCIVALACYISFLYAYAINYNNFFPLAIPFWMMDAYLVFYPGTFLMPTIFYSLFALVVSFQIRLIERRQWLGLLFAVAIPVIWYLSYQIILPLWRPVHDDFYIHAIAILLIASTLAFLFFLIKAVYFFVSTRAGAFQKYRLIWLIPITLILPIAGLIVNNNGIFGTFPKGFFGNFSNYWFFILTVLNSVLICLPSLQNKTYRLILFLGRITTFAFTLYFFLVFLPFLPLSIFLMIAVGVGFLMLAPLMLFVVHVNELFVDFAFVNEHFQKRKIVAACVACFLLIPLIITAVYKWDKAVLNEALEYVYSPDYSKKYSIDENSMKNMLHDIKEHKKEIDVIAFQGTPFLSWYYTRIVFDNLTLSDAKINMMESVFSGERYYYQLGSIDIRNSNVKISNIFTKSDYDKERGVWTSWIDLEITRRAVANQNFGFAEYATVFNIPEGCFISDYYLYIGERKEPGILAEKKAAMWVFNKIRSENLDPGLLHYLNGNGILFRVFPFSAGEKRKTGIEFLHKEPVSLSIDGHTIKLGNETPVENVEMTNAVYVAAKQKQFLPRIKRKPYLHFLLDASLGTEEAAEKLIQQVEHFTKMNAALAKDARISFVNTYVETVPLDDKWSARYKSSSFEGGYYLDRAIKKALFDTYTQQEESYPILIAVTDNFNKALIHNDFSDWQFTFPEDDKFYELNKDGKLFSHSLTKDPNQGKLINKLDISKHVLAYKLTDGKEIYLPDNNKPSLVPKGNALVAADRDMQEKNWMSAAAMQGMWHSQTLYPKTSLKDPFALVKLSFLSKIMTPATSYIVVENEAQKAMLLKKQQQALSGNKNLDLEEETQSMSEPGLLLMAVLLGVVLYFLKKRKRRLV